MKNTIFTILKSFHFTVNHEYDVCNKHTNKKTTK